MLASIAERASPILEKVAIVEGVAEMRKAMQAGGRQKKTRLSLQ